MAAVDYFLKLDGVEGESGDDKHKNEISLESFSWGATQSGTHGSGGGGGAGKVSMQDFHFVMKVCKASPKLLLSCAEGTHIPKGVLVARKAGKNQQEFMTVTMNNILVSSYQTGGSGGADIIPTDQISLNFEKIVFEYKEQKPDGSLGAAIKAGWDQVKNVKV